MLAPQETPVIYPESDGKPMAETDVHRNLLLRMVDLLQNAFPNAYASGNICLYYEPGNPKKMISPDALLCCSQSKGEKRVYLAWEANHQLDLVMEFSSFSTRRVDHYKKKQIYEKILKVPYYIIFDPHAIYLNVYALVEGNYQPQEANEQGYWLLETLKIQVGIENSNTLRLFDMAGNLIPTTTEKEAQRAEKEAQRAEKLEKQLQQTTKQAEKDKQALLEEIETLRQQLQEKR